MQDLLTVLFLVFMEGILSFDNALALAAMVKNLPPVQQKKALTYGIAGAFAFRAISLFFITQLMESAILRGFGGGYLVALCVKHFLSHSDGEVKTLPTMGFLKVLLMVELTDIAFSVDSIMASVGITQKYWIVVTGGILGIIMMRFAASIFINLMARFPNLERSAYVLIGIAGTKLLLEAFKYTAYPVWIFPTFMGLALASGFIGNKVEAQA